MTDAVPHCPKYVVLKDANGREVNRHRTDRMNFAAFTWLYALLKERHGEMSIELEPISEEAT